MIDNLLNAIAMYFQIVAIYMLVEKEKFPLVDKTQLKYSEDEGRASERSENSKRTVDCVQENCIIKTKRLSTTAMKNILVGVL